MQSPNYRLSVLSLALSLAWMPYTCLNQSRFCFTWLLLPSARLYALQRAQSTWRDGIKQRLTL